MHLILATFLLLAQGFAHRSNPGTPGATLPTITSTTCPGTGCVTLGTGGASAMLVTIAAAGACPGANCTLTFACTKDNWATNTPIAADALSGGSLSGAPASTTTAAGTFLMPTYAFPSCGVVATAYVSGTASVDLQGDPAFLPAIGATGAAAAQSQGTLTNNNAAPSANNFGALGAVANAAIPSWTEGNEVLTSVDLHGSQRATILNAAGTQVTNGVGSATNTGAIMAGGKDGSGNVQLFGVGVTGATAPANAIMLGGGSVAGATTLTGVTVKAASVAPAPTDTAVVVAISPIGDPCVSSATKSSVPINISSATTTQLVALSGSLVIYVCGFVLTSTGVTTATTALFEYGTGASCGTGTTALTGTMGQSLLTSAIVTVASGATQFKSAAANALCLLSAGTTPNIQGYVTYVQQ